MADTDNTQPESSQENDNKQAAQPDNPAPGGKKDDKKKVQRYHGQDQKTFTDEILDQVKRLNDLVENNYFQKYVGDHIKDAVLHPFKTYDKIKDGINRLRSDDSPQSNNNANQEQATDVAAEVEAEDSMQARMTAPEPTPSQPELQMSASDTQTLDANHAESVNRAAQATETLANDPAVRTAVTGGL